MSKIDAKVVLLGKAHVGKTCLVNRYIRGTFDSTVPYQNTIGAAFGSKKETVNGKSIILGIWDTAGHERYESMVKLYYRGAMAAILCFDLTDKTSFDRVRFWAGELRQMEKGCKLFLCGTKKDLVDYDAYKREITVKTAKPLADDLQAALFETSSKSGENIEQLFQSVAKYCLQKTEEDERKQHGEEDRIRLGREKSYLLNRRCIRIPKCL
ncbi:hypothetical protein CHS0354_006086 [Potamilus streckersoni]|uniref:Ras-related protein Rab-24 n=1 Tax=Potamilus streckersoni TaxID=2493646 RepID=A0AAE0W1J5_9BIVA|nr:hypothetical protein CHS0354_006086 [Potamilus streckersoni]